MLLTPNMLNGLSYFMILMYPSILTKGNFYLKKKNTQQQQQQIVSDMIMQEQPY